MAKKELTDAIDLDSLPKLEQVFLARLKSKHCPAPNWVPWGYDQDPDDPKLYHPNLKAYRIMFKACKYAYADATHESCANWVQYHCWETLQKKYSCSGELFSKMYKVFKSCMHEKLVEGKVKAVLDKKLKHEQRTGRTLSVGGELKGIQTPQEKQEQEAEEL